MSGHTDGELQWDNVANAVMRYCISTGLDQTSAEEIAQEVTFLTWRRWSTGDPLISGVMPWAITVAKNRMRRQGRDSRTHRRIEAQYLNLTREIPVDPPDLSEASVVAAAIQQLSEIQAEVIRLHYFADFDYSEIADRLDISVSTVRSHARRARMRMAQILSKSLERSGD